MPLRSSLYVFSPILLCCALWWGTTPALAQTNNYTAGQNAGSSLTTGDFNTAVGISAGRSLTSGSYNVFYGFGAGQVTNGDSLTFIGYLAGNANTTGRAGVFVGAYAGRLNTTGHFNTFLGAYAGENNTTGSNNTFVGQEAGQDNTTGYDNTFIGRQAASSNTTGYRNTFVGAEGTGNTITGYQNVAVGKDALDDLTTGYRNAVMGDSAGADIGAGTYNTMVGQAVGANTEHADFNTFIGARAGFDNNRTNGTANANRNTYVGFSAGYTNREGEDNVGVGYLADFTGNGSGDDSNQRNVFIGTTASIARPGNISTGYDDNVVLGYGATAATDNGIAIGSGAQVSGAASIAIGYQANVSGSNSIAIGSGTTVSSNNEVYLGNFATNQIGGLVNWSTSSDARLKTDVIEAVPGLSFIERLRPVQYRFHADSLRAMTTVDGLDDAILAKSEQWETGFLAQEVAAAAEAEGFAFSGVVHPESGRRHYGLRYATFVVPLTQAVQELDTRTQHTERGLAELEASVAPLSSDTPAVLSTYRDRLGAYQRLLGPTAATDRR